MTEQRRPLRDKKAWAGGSQKRRGDWTERNDNGIWDSQYVRMDRIYKDVTCVKWGSGLLKDNPQSRWRLLRVDCDGMRKRWGGGRYAFFLYYLNYHKDNKKSFGCPELKSSSRAKCKDWEPATQNFLFLYVFFTFSLSFYLSSALISLLSPTSRRAKEQ